MVSLCCFVNIVISRLWILLHSDSFLLEDSHEIKGFSVVGLGNQNLPQVLMYLNVYLALDSDLIAYKALYEL